MVELQSLGQPAIESAAGSPAQPSPTFFPNLSASHGRLPPASAAAAAATGCRGGCLVGCLLDCLLDCLDCYRFGWQAGRLVEHLVGWLVDCLVGRQAARGGRLRIQPMAGHIRTMLHPVGHPFKGEPAAAKSCVKIEACLAFS